MRKRERREFASFWHRRLGRSWRPKGGAKGGFTLIELLVVVALVALLVGVGFLYYKKYEWSALTGSAATQLATHLMIARTSAIKSSADYLVGFVTSGQTGRYYFCRAHPDPSQNSCDPYSLPRFYSLPKGVKFGKIASLPHVPDMGCSEPPASDTGVVINCSSDYNSFRFGFDGAVFTSDRSNAAGVVVYLIPANSEAQRSDNQRAVSLGALSGQVRMWKYTGSSWR